MNALVKKEIRLLLPGWIVAVLLALPPVCTRSDDGIPVFLLFLGLAMLALTSIGRESSLNTFSLLLAQPTERIRIWKTKLSVLATAFFVVFAVWRLAIIFSFKDYGGHEVDADASAAVLTAGSLVLVSTFTGGLWTTLLLRQIAGAFWLTLLMPAVLAGFTAAFLANAQSNNAVIAALAVIIAIYSVGGFLLARRLFFHAQDVGWTGGIIALPEWKFFAASSNAADSPRTRKPMFALLKKEFQLQQVSMMGAAALLVLHLGVIALRTHHKFARESAGEILTSIFWMLWLVLPVIIGAMAVAEERRLGVMEGQLCLPVSRRVQFLIKGFLALLLGTLLGGVLPMLLESISHHTIFKPVDHSDAGGIVALKISIVALSAWLALASFFASSLARNFLQAVGFAIATFVGTVLLGSALIGGRMFFFASIPVHSVLPIVVAVPTTIVTLLWLAYLNFKNFHDGWPLWRRNLLGWIGAFGFIVVISAALYNRVWEVFEPAEPAHGAAKLSLVNPPSMRHASFVDDLLVQLPNGRVWFDRIDTKHSGNLLRDEIRWAINPFPTSVGPEQFMFGSNWVSATFRQFVYAAPDQKTNIFVYLETVGIQSDGTLWVSEKSSSPHWTGDSLTKFGTETNWQALSWSWPESSVLLLKKDGTLWCWGTNHWENPASLTHRTSLRELNPYRLGTNSDWAKIVPNNNHLQKADGSVWRVSVNPKNGKVGFLRDTNWDQVELEKIPQQSGPPFHFYVRKDGTLWGSFDRRRKDSKSIVENSQIGKETNWVSVATEWTGTLVALKSDGTLWQPDRKNQLWSSTELSARLSIHSDWVALTTAQDGVLSLAADGSLWLWPNRELYSYQNTLLKLPKQPKFLGNVFNKQD